MKEVYNRCLVGIRKYSNQIDYLLLIFLILFLNVKLPVKLIGLILIYAMRFNFKFSLSLKNNTRLPVFSLLIALLTIVLFFFQLNFNTNYLLLVSAIIGIWLMGFLATHQLKLAVEQSGLQKIHNTLKLFFVLNAGFSLANVLAMMLDCGDINPYSFEGLGLKYHASAGDYVKGLSFDKCTVNMIINIFGMFYFLYSGSILMSLLCMLVVLLTTSNMGNSILIFFLCALLLFERNRLIKSATLVFMAMLVIFMVKISNANLVYFKGSFKTPPALANKTNAVESRVISEKPDVNPHFQTKQTHKLNTDSILRAYVQRKLNSVKPKSTNAVFRDQQVAELQQKIARIAPPPIKTDTVFVKSTLSVHNKMLAYCKSLYADSIVASSVPGMFKPNQAGKLTAFYQTYYFLTDKPFNLLAGAGPGNFSSKFTFRALGLNDNGNWPQSLTYLHPLFKYNHLKTWLYYQIQPLSKHSVVNAPNSFINQLFGEYGLVGAGLFLFFYLLYFLKKIKLLSYGKLILPLFVVFLATDYWFESLSIVVIFELMLFLDMEKNKPAIDANA